MARKKTQKSFSRGIPERPYQGILDEALAVVFFGFAGFVLLSVISFHLSSCAGAGPCSAANLLGPVGHVTATVLHGFLGWCSLVPVVWALSLAIYCWRYDARADRGEAVVPSVGGLVWGLVGILLTVVALATIGAALAGRAGGGSIGMLLALPLVRFVNVPGTFLLSSLVLMFALALALQRTVGEVIVLLVAGLRTTLTWLLTTAPNLVFRIGLFILQSLQFGVIALIGRLGLRHLRPKERSVPQPRLRRRGTTEAEKVVEEGDAELVDARPVAEEPDTELLEPRDLADIVVERRDATDLRVVLPGSRERHTAAQKRASLKEEMPVVPYEAPPIDLLQVSEPMVGRENDDELRDKSRQIEMKLRDFGILGKVTHVHPGPVITLFEFEPAPGVKVGRIAALQDDLAMSLKASSIRILAPIPKRGTVGIEVPNRHRDMVRLRDCLESKEFLNSDSILSVPFGKDTYGDPVIVDIAAMPHLLIAGATGTGKSVCINALLVSLLYRADPDELGLILIDPKILELSTYDSVPHLRVPVVTVPRQAKAVLEWAVNEMNRRYRLMQRYGVRNIDGYNRMVRGEPDENDEPKKKVADAGAPIVELHEAEVIASGTVTPESPHEEDPVSVTGEELKPLSKIVIVIDELADLMLTVGKDIEELITRLAQKARASGIHLMVATQRPSVDVITGLIKANFPARISFRVTTRVDSRTILDSMGAEKLLGRGDMLFMAPGADSLKRLHGAFVSDNEVKKVVDWLRKQGAPRFDERIMAICEKALEDDANQGSSGSGGVDGGPAAEADPLYDRAVELVLQKGQASTSMIQRAFRIGYNRAARLVDFMEKEGVVGPADGARPRDVLVNRADENSPPSVTLDDSKF